MKFTNLLSMLLLTILGISVLPSYAQMECKCHSKQPSMKRMHEITGFSRCGDCHSKNENLMSGNRNTSPDRKADLAKRIREDKACIPCHEPDGQVKKEIYSKMR